jgi:hypothetical protein
MEDNFAQLKNLHRTKNPFKSYAELPQGVSYQDQEQGEFVAILLRRHPITNFRWSFIALVAALVPIIINLTPLADIGLGGLAQIPAHIQQLIFLFWFTLILGYVLQNMLICYFNVYLITNRRIVDVDFHGLMHYASDEAALHQIQDVSHSQRGLWQLLFRYGTVHLQTAGTRQNLDFERVPSPARVADIVTDLLPIPEDVRQGQITLGRSNPAKTESAGAKS